MAHRMADVSDSFADDDVLANDVLAVLADDDPLAHDVLADDVLEVVPPDMFAVVEVSFMEGIGSPQSSSIASSSDWRYGTAASIQLVDFVNIVDFVGFLLGIGLRLLPIVVRR